MRPVINCYSSCFADAQTVRPYISVFCDTLLICKDSNFFQIKPALRWLQCEQSPQGRLAVKSSNVSFKFVGEAMQRVSAVFQRIRGGSLHLVHDVATLFLGGIHQVGALLFGRFGIF